MANDVRISYNVEVVDNNDLANRYLLDNGLVKEGDRVSRLLLEDGDLVLTRDINRIKQHIITGLHLLIGDWVLDQSQGISYFTGMRAYPGILSAQIKNAINTVDGVDTVLKYNFQQALYFLIISRP